MNEVLTEGGEGREVWRWMIEAVKTTVMLSNLQAGVSGITSGRARIIASAHNVSRFLTSEEKVGGNFPCIWFSTMANALCHHGS